MTEQAADVAVDTACRALTLPPIRAQCTAAPAAEEREQMTYRGFLAEMLMGECEDRDRRRSERRLKAAGFPTAEMAQGGQPLSLIGDAPGPVNRTC
jgi:hypothetical protein